MAGIILTTLAGMGIIVGGLIGALILIGIVEAIDNRPKLKSSIQTIFTITIILAICWVIGKGVTGGW